jgi:Zn finger protein HypA/HybF involved in hydrogenase expression
MMEAVAKIKRKIVPEVPVVSKEIIEQAKLALETDKIKRVAKCVVCETECAPNSAEGLCWVCRRLKISAWRDSDSQASAQE